jgi:hypothetical protein
MNGIEPPGLYFSKMALLSPVSWSSGWFVLVCVSMPVKPRYWLV